MNEQLKLFTTKYEKVPSLIKWTGSKRKSSEQIIKYFPDIINNYFEPFLGGGSILYSVKSLNPNCKVYGSDLYNPLIEIFKNVSKNPEIVKKNYRKDWLKLQKNFPEYYYFKRLEFNKKKQFQDLIFLSRTCVNGIIRFNKNQEFNNSLHLSRKGMQPDMFDKVVDKWHFNICNKSIFKCHDYSKIINLLQKGDFVYMDPPYFNSQNRYIENLDFKKFINFLFDLKKTKVMFALSFDGNRDGVSFEKELPKNLFKRKINIKNSISTLSNVLNKKKSIFSDILYLSY